MTLDAWVLLNIEPELLNEEFDGNRYEFLEAFANNIPATLKPDRQGRYYVRIPRELFAMVRSLSTLTPVPSLRSASKVLMYGTHYGFVKILTGSRWKIIYRLNRAMATSTPAIKELYGDTGLQLLIEPNVEMPGNLKRVSVIPLIYENRTTNNIDTMTAIFGQLLPRDLLVSWAVARAISESRTASTYGFSEDAKALASRLEKLTKRELKEKAVLLRVMSSHPDFNDVLLEKSPEAYEGFKKYMGGLND